MALPKRPLGLKQNIDKLLFISATGYLIVIVAWFLKPSPLQTNLNNNQTISKVKVVEENVLEQNNNLEDVHILNVKQQKEENVNNKNIQAESNLISTSVIAKPLPNISTLKPSQNNLIPPQSLPIIPVASLPTIPPLSPSPSINNNNSSLPKPLKVPMPPPPTPQKTTRVKSVPVLSSNHNNVAYPQETYVPPPSSTEETNQTNLGKTNFNYSLVGLIQLENQSDLALFKINNSTQRVKLGEEIGASGWILIAVTEKQAIINQLGNSRYLTVGEKF